MVLTNVNSKVICSTCMYCITSPFPLHVGATSCSSPFSSSPSSPPFMGKIVPQFVSFSLGGARTSPYFGTFETFGEHSRTYTRAQCGRTATCARGACAVSISLAALSNCEVSFQSQSTWRLFRSIQRCPRQRRPAKSGGVASLTTLRADSCSGEARNPRGVQFGHVC